MSRPITKTCRICGELASSNRSSTCGKRECRKERERISEKERTERLKAQGLCRGCGKVNDGSRDRCTRCMEKSDARHHRYYKESTSQGVCTICKGVPLEGLTLCGSCKERTAELDKQSNLKVKTEAMMGYGGCLCQCCGETEMTMLAIDHIDQNGAEDRRSGRKKSGRSLYRLLIKEGFPEGFRVLCYNCNVAVFRDPNHICPHRKGVFKDAA